MPAADDVNRATEPVTDPEGATQSAAEPAGSAAEGDDQPAELDLEPELVLTETEHEVTLQRSVRYGRVIIGAAVLGAVLAALISTLFPVQEEAAYTMAQVAGFSALIGAVIGLALGGVLALVLGSVAKRGAGTGIAIQTDVR